MKVHMNVPAEWCHNPSAQRQLSASSLGEVFGKLHIYSQSSIKSLLASLPAVASWWPTSFLSLGSPEREATMEGF